MEHLTYRPERHNLVGVETMPSTTGRGIVVGWFVRLTYTGDPVRDFRGTRCDVLFFETEAEAFEFSDQFKVGS